MWKEFRTLLFILQLFRTSYALQCLEGKDLPQPDSAKTVTTCSPDSRCYVQQVVTSGGLVLYNLGCMSIGKCSSRRSIAWKRQLSTDIVTCLECCDGNMCNIQGCGTNVVALSQRPPFCFFCETQMDPGSCRDVIACDADHICGLYMVFTNGNEYMWRSQCLPLSQCQSLKSSGNLCVSCCDEDFCNNNCTQTPTSTTLLITTKPTAVALTSSPTALTSNIANSKITISSTNTHYVTHLASSNTAINTTYFNSHTTLSGTGTLPHSIGTSPSRAGTSISTAHTKSSTTSTTHAAVTTYKITASTQSTQQTSKTSHRTASTLPTHTTHISTTTVQHIVPTHTPGCRHNPVDLCFVIDSSGSLGAHAFQKELAFVVETVHKLFWNRFQDLRVCVITFSTDSAVNVHLTTYTGAVESTILKIPYMDGETNTHIAMSDLLHEFRRHGRNNVDKVAILITDGDSNEPAEFIREAHLNTQYTSTVRPVYNSQPRERQKVAALNSAGVDLYGVGIGSYVNKHQLHQAIQHSYFVSNVENLDLAHSHLRQTICKC